MALQMELHKPTGYEIEQVYHKDDSTSTDIMNTSSHQLCCMLDTSIQDVREKKKTIVTTMELVNWLMGEVEKEERAAEEAKEETALSGLDILAKVEERKQMLLQFQEANNMVLVEKLNAEKDVLATKMEALRGRVTNMLDDEDRSLDLLNKMRTSLELRLESALTEKELAFRKKEENEYALAYHENQIERSVEEYHRLKEETFENYKLQKILDDRHQSVEMLHEEISDNFKDLNLIKEGVDPSVPLLTYDSTTSCLKKQEDNKNAVAAITEEPQVMLSEGSVDLKSTLESNNCGENHKSIAETKKSADTDNRKAGANDIQLINGDMSDKLVEVEPLLSKNLNSTSLEKPEEHKNVGAPITEEPKALLMESSVALKSTIKSNDCGEKPKPEAKINGLKVDSIEEKVTEEEAILRFILVLIC
ncbi:hypothetical protein CTI12_AA088950 [Artemisia annua]|uniref:Uncharacterized protein n=1 Tax=Artemisia annua TaxID=35608 RepID=A0A2U1Q156_ARTAN|nr:hypothetical protein CTI12_AA088950 [Artemisia annua]